MKGLMYAIFVLLSGLFSTGECEAFAYTFPASSKNNKVAVPSDLESSADVVETEDLDNLARAKQLEAQLNAVEVKIGESKGHLSDLKTTIQTDQAALLRYQNTLTSDQSMLTSDQNTLDLLRNMDREIG